MTTNLTAVSDDIQLVVPPPDLDPRIVVELARMIPNNGFLARPRRAAFLALTVASWVADRFLKDDINLPPAPVPSTFNTPFVPDGHQMEAVLMQVAEDIAPDPITPTPGVQAALPPVDWAQVIQIVIFVIQQVIPLLGRPA